MDTRDAFYTLHMKTKPKVLDTVVDIIKISKSAFPGKCIRFLTYFFVVAEPMCDVKYQKLGCFKDRTKKPRLLEKLILTDRDPKSPVFSNFSVDWGNWDSYLPSLACRCAKKAAEYKYTHFGLQHYGRLSALYNCIHLFCVFLVRFGGHFIYQSVCSF